jgi:hypothetical protein
MAVPEQAADDFIVLHVQAAKSSAADCNHTTLAF